ncbi:serine/threonine-protein kinase [Microtetraspora malaysiensis]|uniref:serine/threonine-protein kinase n=1 Tax=Microtetraspora malaysiensis TaxID=161358 RepID=UPI003D945DB1
MPESSGGRLASRYLLRRQLGSGGMGTVWLAWDEMLQREVAIKELRLPDGLDEAERAHTVERAVREARAAARVRHPGIVSLHDVLVEDRRPWIIMELLRGRTLADEVKERGPLPPERAARVGAEVLDALREAHAHGIQHRDVKPANVFLNEDGRTMLTDFGIARLEGQVTLTAADTTIGSPGFISPERLDGATGGPASDLWSLGASLYLATEGAPAYDGGPVERIHATLANRTPPPPRRAGALGPLLMWMMDRDPAARPDTATALRLLIDISEGRSPTLSPVPAAPAPIPPASFGPYNEPIPPGPVAPGPGYPGPQSGQGGAPFAGATGYPVWQGAGGPGHPVGVADHSNPHNVVHQPGPHDPWAAAPGMPNAAVDVAFPGAPHGPRTGPTHPAVPNAPGTADPPATRRRMLLGGAVVALVAAVAATVAFVVLPDGSAQKAPSFTRPVDFCALLTSEQVHEVVRTAPAPKGAVSGAGCEWAVRGEGISLIPKKDSDTPDPWAMTEESSSLLYESLAKKYAKGLKGDWKWKEIGQTRPIAFVQTAPRPVKGVGDEALAYEFTTAQGHTFGGVVLFRLGDLVVEAAYSTLSTTPTDDDIRSAALSVARMGDAALRTKG